MSGLRLRTLPGSASRRFEAPTKNPPALPGDTCSSSTNTFFKAWPAYWRLALGPGKRQGSVPLAKETPNEFPHFRSKARPSPPTPTPRAAGAILLRVRMTPDGLARRLRSAGAILLRVRMTPDGLARRLRGAGAIVVGMNGPAVRFTHRLIAARVRNPRAARSHQQHHRGRRVDREPPCFPQKIAPTFQVCAFVWSSTFIFRPTICTRVHLRGSS